MKTRTSSCPHCKDNFNWPVMYSGHTIPCPNCGGDVTLPVIKTLGGKIFGGVKAVIVGLDRGGENIIGRVINWMTQPYLGGVIFLSAAGIILCLAAKESEPVSAIQQCVTAIRGVGGLMLIALAMILHALAKLLAKKN